MINTTKLLKVIRDNKTDQKHLAKELGISDRTFYDKMKRKEFLVSEVAGMMEVLEFTIDPFEIFFEGVNPVIIEVKKYNKKGIV